MQDYFNTPIFILGLPRSGTSMIAGAISICGAWTGSTVPGGSPVNPKGFFEHTVIRELVTKKILTHLGCDPLGVKQIPPVDLHGHIPGFAQTLQKIIEREGYTHDRRWLYKDAKLTLIWPFYKNAFPHATWLVVRRDEQGFINSCLNTPFMKQHSQDPAFWKQFSNEYRIRLHALNNSGANVLEISSPDVIAGDFSRLREVVKQLGLEFREKELMEFISPAYWHNISNPHTRSEP